MTQTQLPPSSVDLDPVAPGSLRDEVSSVRRWIVEHDERWLFIGAYITLAVVLSIAISLFWLIAVVAVHGVFEWVRQRQHPHDDFRSTIVRVAWELKLDIALVFFALVVAVYMDVVLGAAGLGAAARMGVQTGARFAGWQHIIRGALLSVDDAAQLVRAVGNRGRSTAEAEAAAAPSPRRWGGWAQPRWGVGDRIALWLLMLSIIVLLISPWITQQPPADIVGILLGELHPWPGGAAAEDL